MSALGRYQHTWNLPTDILEILQSFYAFLIVHNCYRNHHAKFEIYRIILTCLNLQSELSLTDRGTYIDRPLIQKTQNFYFIHIIYIEYHLLKGKYALIIVVNTDIYTTCHYKCTKCIFKPTIFYIKGSSVLQCRIAHFVNIIHVRIVAQISNLI